MNLARLLQRYRLVLSLCLGLAATGAPAKPPQPLVLGVHPYLPNEQLQRRFAPLARYVSEHLERRVIVRVGHSYQEEIHALGNETLDIAFMGPVTYVRMVERYGRQPILAQLQRSGQPQLLGDIVVSHNSPITSVEQLDGKTFAFGDPHSTIATIVPMAFLAGSGIDVDALANHRHYRGHTNIALAVLSDQADAGAVKREVLENYRKHGLRSLTSLPAVPEHVFVARSTLPAELIARLREILRHLHRDSTGLAALQALNRHASALGPANDADFDGLRDILASVPVDYPSAKHE